MAYGVLKAFVGTLSICVILSGVFSHAACSIDTIIVNGRVDSEACRAAGSRWKRGRIRPG